MKAMPRIDKYMTVMPHSIGAEMPMKKALEMMREYGFRHLPVQEAGRLVGVLTDRDVKLAASFSGASELKVEDIMTPDPYTVRPEVSLSTVVTEMAEHKYGCAIIEQDNHKVVGIFTATDALRILGEVLRDHYAPAK